MRESIPRNVDDFKNIQADDLKVREVTENEKALMLRFAKKYNGKSTIPILLAVLVGTGVVALGLLNFELLDKEGIEFCFIFAGFFYLVAFLAWRDRIKVSQAVKGIQIGLANGVWSYQAGLNKRRSYYVDVVFADEKRRLKKVICLDNEYDDINQGEEILVFTYDKKRVFGCRVKR